MTVDHAKVHADDCHDCGRARRQDRPLRAGDRVRARSTPRQGAKLLEIANKCPVHRTLEAGAAVVTKLVADEDPID